MALPQDFWQNEHMFHRFRSKPCQRLLRSGICEWHSQCQFSHDPEWPRRPPNKINYSPALCPHIRAVLLNNSGEVQLENSCPAGLSCTFSHTKDEVLYHPSIFKTNLCEEHRSLTVDQRTARRSKHRPRCHRYYCPFAHGKQELRTSPMPPEQREAVIRATGVFAHGGCCGICSINHMGPIFMDSSQGTNYSNMPMGQPEASIPQSQLWPGSAQSMLGQMVLSGTATETTTSDISEGHVWGTTSPWLLGQQQQSIHQIEQKAGGLHSATKTTQNLSMTKEQPQVTQEVQADDGEEDVDSEIYERAVRFLDEISTEESGSEDMPTPVAKADTIQLSQVVKESGPGSNNRAFPPMWNPQEAWVSDGGKDQWQVDLGTNHWAMRSFDRIS